MTDAIEEIKKGHARGWSFTKLQGKAPCLNRWQDAPRASLGECLAWATQPWACWLDPRMPMTSIGLRTGAASGISVIDIEADSPVTRETFPPTVTVFTGGGGFHLYYRHPAEGGVGNRSGTLRHPATGEKLPRVDVRGDGGQVVFVGSIHPHTGKQYRWFPLAGPDHRDLAPFPTAFLARPKPTVRPANPGMSPIGDIEKRCMAYLAKLDDAVSGSGGHNATFTAACVCWRFGLAEIQVHRVMQWFNAGKCRPEWSEKELAHKIASSRRTVEEAGEIGWFLRQDRPRSDPAPAQAVEEFTGF